MGISASQHNGAACLMHGNDIVVAIAEERLTRVKRQGICGARPSLAFEYCLASAGLGAANVDMVVLCTQSSRLREHDVRTNPQLAGLVRSRRVTYISHHLGHALSTLRWAGTSDAAVLVVDGLGSPVEDLADNEQVLAHHRKACISEIVSMYVARRWELKPLEKLFAPTEAWFNPRVDGMPSYGSLGGMYAAVSQYIFRDAMEAGKVMGLASHAQAAVPVNRFLRLLQGGQIEYLDHVPEQFGNSIRSNQITAAHKMLAASVQAALEEGLLHLVRRLRALCSERTLCLAGGVALNAIANERLLRESGFHRISVIPAADDGGTAVGAAVAGLLALGWPMAGKAIRDDGLGHTYDEAAILHAAERVPGLRWSSPQRLIKTTAERLAFGHILGWIQGGSEFGPRALGHRSILADARQFETKRRLDTQVKRRESFRPYAPAVLHAEVARWFDMGPHSDSPFMLRIVPVRPDVRAAIPAVVHVDGTARIQTVRRRDGKFFQLIKEFNNLTGVPLVLNTSFNVQGEPIVETPEDALWSLLGGGLDFCVIGSMLFEWDRAARSLLDRRVIWRERVQPELGRSCWPALQCHPHVKVIFDQVNGRRTGREIGDRIATSGIRISNDLLLRTLVRLAGLQVICFDRR